MDRDIKARYIKEVLEENLDMVWKDKIVYSHNSKTYREVNMLIDFQNNRTTYVRLEDRKKKGHMAKVKLNNESFVIEIDGLKIDVSDHWQELLRQEMLVSTSVG